MWKIEWDSKALKEAKKLDRNARKKIIDYLENRVLQSQNPYQYGKHSKVIKQESGGTELEITAFSAQ